MAFTYKFTRKEQNMERKIAVVTGANSGMGFSTTIGLMQRGIHVVMLCRNEEKGKAAMKEAIERSNSANVEMIVCDLGSVESIAAFAQKYKEKYDVLDVIVNNAGVVTVKRESTKDGFESEIGINHLGHFLLNQLLLDELKKAEQGRIVVVSSGAHKWGDIYFQDPHFENGFNVLKGYGQSKLANILYTKELSRKLTGTNVTVNALHPGAVSTSLGMDRETGFGKSIIKLLKPFFQTPDEGASTAIYLAVSNEAAETTGEYFYSRKRAAVSKKAEDKKLAAHLWDWSEAELARVGAPSI